MKLTIKKSTYRRNLNKAFFIVILFIAFNLFSLNSFSQTYSFKFNDISLSEALTEIAQKTNIRLSFDSEMLGKTKTSIIINQVEISDILTSLLENTGFTYEFKYNTYLIYKKKQERLNEEKTLKAKTFTGIVFDKESGERLPYATIYVWETSLSVSSTVEGTFSVQLEDSTQNFIQVKYLGYQNLDTVISTSQASPFFRFGLTKKSQNIETVNITGDKLEMVDFSNEAGHLVFNPSKFADLPNYGETDVFRALQLLPGISSFENSSQLNVRGSSADQNLVLLDGFTLYNLDHFFGVFSALNPNVIKNIQVYRGGFDSRYGERISAIVDIVGKSGNHTKPQFYGGINMISGNLTAEIPISKKLTLIAAGRRAYSDVYSTWLADELLNDKLGQARRLPSPDANIITPKFFFSDYNLKLSYQISDQENISFSGYGSKDYLNSSNNNSNERGDLETEDKNEWGNYGLGTTWNKQWNAKYFTSLQVGHSGYYNNYNNNTTITFSNSSPDSSVVVDSEINEVIYERNELTDYFITLRNEYQLDSRNKIQFGLSTKYNQFIFYKDATRDFIYDNLKSSAFLHTAFLQDNLNIDNKLILKPGVRLNYYSNSGKFYLEPRLSASYSAESGITLKMATGKYFQYLNKSGSEQTYGYNRDFWILADGDVNPVLSSNHYIAGVSFEKNDFYFDVEAYFKTVKGLQEYLFFDSPERRDNQNPPSENTAPLSLFISGTGKAMGIDFLVKYEGGYFTSWLAYSLSKATRSFDEINSGDEIPSDFDQTHEFKWTNIYNYNRWNFSALTIFTTGKPYIKSSIKEDDFTSTRVYRRLPNYFRFDFSANYNFNIKKVNIKPGLSVLNAFNTENYLDIYTRVFDVGDNSFNQTSLVKAQSLTFNFFINFRF